ncbi:MAG TPA: crosslink repair DNA glycosylase YcaQ family protein [Longimicrobiales bacterium]|nr:crosslink repair DNA glycosylase YcaQ family protein [Longimicrobiales bacterium]
MGGSDIRLTADAARLVHVAAQGLDRRPDGPVTKHDVLEAVRRMAVLQLDTIHVVARSPYLVLFSRLNQYEPCWLDELLAEGALFEYWAHEASLLPREDYGLLRHRMLAPEGMGWKYRTEWVAENRHHMDRVLEHVRRNGAVRSADFERQDDAASAWWGWKPEKRALEYLLTAGELMVARRERFQRVYDLRERVHTGWHDDMLPDPHEAQRQLVLRAVHALGVTQVRWVADYYRMNRRTTPAMVRELVADGELLPAHVDGWEDDVVIHPAHLDRADAAAAGSLEATRTTLLSPFDPLVWDRQRARVMFGFDYRLECYTPAAKRRWGYFVLPILSRGELVGRADIKAHRRTGAFEVKALYVEEHVMPSAELLADIAAALQEAAAWHGTPRVRLGRVRPTALRRELARLVRLKTPAPK